MAGAELAGLGLTSVAAKIAAPNLKFLDPLKGARQQIGDFVKTLPAHTKAAARRVEEMLPENAALTARDAMESLRGAAEQANTIFRRLVSTDTAKLAPAELGSPALRRTADQVARSIGEQRTKLFGFEQGKEAKFLSDVFRSGSRDVLETVRKRTTARGFNDFLAHNLAILIRRSTTKLPDGRFALDGERLLAQWQKLPEASQRLYSASTRHAIESLATFGSTLKRVGKFAASPIGGEVIEHAAIPAASAIFGPSVGVPLLVARALLMPGMLQRYLTRETLPGEITQLLAGQAVKGEIRRSAGGLLDDEDR
jgi:hypothetical protein